MVPGAQVSYYTDRQVCLPRQGYTATGNCHWYTPGVHSMTTYQKPSQAPNPHHPTQPNRTPTPPSSPRPLVPPTPTYNSTPGSYFYI